jgi:crotonobetainyl-CoA:carnitine CoA-transferase CaiB-like acyl-CoA transferase
MRPLDGVTVLDLTRLLPGAAATLMLANFGAEVTKIEAPGGDYARHMPPLVDGEGAVFRATNRGKKSIALNLKTAEGKATLRKLATGADVLIEGFRPGVMKRLGFDYETLRPLNERLIYVSLTGYGQTGPHSAMAGHDINYIALGGLLDVTGAIPGAQIADLAGGSMQAVIGILLALAARQKTGRGQFVDVSMLDGVAWLMTLPLAIYEATGEIPRAGAAMLSGRYACYQTYRAADGRWLAVGALEPKFWAALCEKLGRREWIADQFAEGERQAAMIQDLRNTFKSKPSTEWLSLFEGADVCVTLVRNVAEVAAGRASEVIPKLSDTPGRVGGRAPRKWEGARQEGSR